MLAAIPLGLGGYHAVFVFSLAFAVLGVIVLGARGAGPENRLAGKAAFGDQGTRHRIALRLSDLSQPALRRVLAVAGLLGLVTVGDGFIYLSLSEAGSLATKYFPLLFVGTSAAYMALAIPLGRVADRVGRARVFLIGHVVLLGVYALTASGVGGGAWSVVLVLLLLGSFYAATDGVLAALATQSVPEESRASGIAAAQTVVALARFACSLGFGLLWQLTGRESALWVMAAALAFGLVAAALLLRPLLTSNVRSAGMKRARLILIMISAVLCLGLAGGYFIYMRAQGSSAMTGSPESAANVGQRARRTPHRVPEQRARRSLRTAGSRPLGRSGRCSRESRADLRADLRDENGWCLLLRQARRSADVRDHHAGCPASAHR